MSKKQLDLRNDNLWKLMMTMSLPGILGMLVVSLNTFVDSLYVGHFIGKEAIAGVSLYFPISLIMSSLTVLICSGAASVLSRAIGAGDEDTQKKLIPTVFTLALIVSVFLTCMGLLFSKTFIALMGGSGEILESGSTYYKICSIGSFFTVAGLSFSALIRAEGKMKRAMMYTSVSVVLNLILAPVFINWFSLGIGGAAWASNIAMGIYLLLEMNYFLSGKSAFKTGEFHLHLDVKLTRDILTIGLSSFLLQAGNFIRQTFIFKSIAYYGTDGDVAFFGAVFRIFIFCITPVFGILQSLQPVVGINYGAGNYQRCTKAVSVFRMGSSLYLILAWIPLLMFPQLILNILLPGEIFSESDLMNFRIMLIPMPLLPVGSSSIIFFQAIGKGNISSIFSIGRELVLFIPLILLFPYLFGKSGVYYGIAMENAIYVFIMLCFTSNEFRKMKLKASVHERELVHTL